MDPSVAAVLLPPLTRFAIAATGVTGSRDVRERLVLAEAGLLAEGDAPALGRDLDVLAGLLASR